MLRFLLICASILPMLAAGYAVGQTRGALSLTPSDSGQSITLYTKSYALVIGIDAYTGGWPRLSNAVADARAVATELKGRGFEVTEVINPKSAELENALRDFIFDKGRDTSAAMFIWFAGHGHTIDGEGYLAAADAPAPSDWTFRKTAYSLRNFGRLMIEAKSRHVLAVFDSCFAGTVFNSVRAIPSKAITRAAALKVRQFISSGEASQQVSDDGTFRKLFIDALKGDEPRADANGDGYITGTEIGLFLSDQVTNLSNGGQTPRYGKLREIGLDRGDFVFKVANNQGVVPPVSAPAIAPPRPAGTVASDTPELSMERLLRTCIHERRHFRSAEIIERYKAKLSATPQQFAWLPEQHHGTPTNANDPRLSWVDVTRVAIADQVLEIDYAWRGGTLRLVPVASRRWGTRSVSPKYGAVASGMQGLWATDNSYGCIELRFDDAGNARGEFGVHASKILDTPVFLRGKAVAREHAPGAETAVLKGHDSVVNHAAFSPDGGRIVTASFDKTARIWDTRTSTVIAVLKGHGDGVVHAAFSPDGARIVTTSWDGTARLWDAKPGTAAGVLKGHRGTVYHAVFSPDGARIVTSASDGTARVWDAKTGAALAVLNGHGIPVNYAAFSADGARIVTASEDNSARIWNAETGVETAVLKGHDGPVNYAVFSPDGAHIVTASADKTARIWDAKTGAETAVLRGHSAYVVLAAPSPDGARIVTASLDKTARLWDAQTGTEIAVLKGHGGTVGYAAFSPDGARIVTASEDHTARIWDANTGAETAVLKGHGGDVVHAAFSPDGARIVTASADKTARVWVAPGPRRPGR